MGERIFSWFFGSDRTLVQVTAAGGR